MRLGTVHWLVVLLSSSSPSPIIAFQHFFQRSSFRYRYIRPAAGILRKRNLLQRFSTVSSSFSEEDLSRWEQLYEAGGKQQSEVELDWTEMDKRSEIRVVSFDLDNTLWKTDKCIGAANDALAKFLDDNGIQQTKRIEKVMRDLFQANKTRYSPILGEQADQATLLTLLRTDAIQKVLEDDNGYSKEKAETFAKTAFDVWATARHDAIPDNLATNVVECLEAISNLRTSTGHPVLIGGITDGNSDPRRVKILEKYFHFCVNAESVGVSKPDKRVYIEAIRKVAKHPAGKDWINLDIDDIHIGPGWVHVGDDFVKDIVAAKDLKMRTVWATELIKEKLMAKVEAVEVSAPNSKGSDEDVKDFFQKLSEKRVVEMAIGADDYLADAFAKEFVDAATEEFHILGDIIAEWHAEGVLDNPVQPSAVAPKPVDDAADEIPRDSLDEVLSVVMPETEKPIADSTTGETIKTRVFRIAREECSTNVVAPLRDRDNRTMKEVMGIAQLDNASGVFAFAPEDVEEIRIGNKVLMVRIEGVELEFTREVFSRMTIQEILCLTEDNPIKLSMYVKEAAKAPSFDMF